MPPTAAPGNPGRGSFTGVPITATRGPTAAKALTIDWVYPVYKPTTGIAPNGTSAAPARRALDLAEAYELLSASDPRPLLVLREFSTFDDPSNERLSRELYTESTVTMSHWFRCVRLPHHVEESNHPFHNLFAAAQPPQLFLATPDGSKTWVFEYQKSGTDLEELMLKVLEETYEPDAERSADRLVKLLARFDQVDAEIRRLKEELDQAIEKDGPKSSRSRKMQKKLQKAESEKAELLAEKEQLQDLPLKST